MAIIKSMCTKCMGKGSINAYDHIANGICFTCKGTGYIEIDEEKQKKAEQRALKRVLKAEANKKPYNKEEEYKKYIDRKHSEALQMNEEYDKRKQAQQKNTETVNDALNSFFNWLEE